MKRFFSILKFIISIGLLVFLFFILREQAGNIIGRLAGVNFFMLGLSFLSFLFSQSLVAFRFKELLCSTGVNFTLIQCIRLYFVGIFFNNFFPTSVGGDIIKAYYTGKHSGKKVESYTMVFIDRFIGLVSMVLVGLFVVAVWGGRVQEPRLIVGLLVVLGIVFVGATLLLSRRIVRYFKFFIPLLKYFKIEEKIVSMFDTVSYVKSRPTLLALTIIFSIISQCVGNISLWLVSLSMNLDVGLLNIFVLFPIIAVVSLLPSLNGLGIRESAMVYFLSPVIGEDGAFALSIQWFFILILTSIVGGIIYATAREFKLILKDEK